jgi:YVTN family beta-propeller protein
VTAIDGAGDTVVARFVTLAGGYVLCTNVAGTRLYVAGEPSYVTVVDCASDSVVADIPVRDNVHGLLYNSVSDKVYACEYVSGQVDIIDPATNSVTATVQVGNGSERMCYSLLDGNVFVDARSYSSVRVVDGTGDSIVASRTFPGYPNDLAYEPVYNRVYTAYFGRPYSTVVMIDATTYNTVGTVEMLGDLERILANPADSTVYVTSYDGAGIYVIGAAAGAVAEPRAALPISDRSASTMVRGVLLMPERTGLSRSASLLDISGRKVMELRPGANDVRALAPGVYFVAEGLRIRGQGSGRIRKVIVTR